MGTEVKKRRANNQDTSFFVSYTVVSAGDFLQSNNHLAQICQDCSLTKETKDCRKQECLASLKRRIKWGKLYHVCLFSLLQWRKCLSHLLCLLINSEKNNDSLYWAWLLHFGRHDNWGFVILYTYFFVLETKRNLAFHMLLLHRRVFS